MTFHQHVQSCIRRAERRFAIGCALLALGLAIDDPLALSSDNLTRSLEARKSMVTVRVLSDHNEVDAVGIVISTEGGVVVDSDILSAGGRINIITKQGEQLPAKVAFVDPQVHLAIIIASKLREPVAEIADSDTLRTADTVILFGAPALTAVRGTYEGRERVGNIPIDLLQISVSIGPGAAAGPVASIQGKLVGMVAQTRMKSRGVLYAVPSNRVAKTIRDWQKMSH